MLAALIWFVIYAVIIGVVAYLLHMLVAKIPMDATVLSIIQLVIVTVAVIAVLVLTLQLLQGVVPAPF